MKNVLTRVDQGVTSRTALSQYFIKAACFAWLRRVLTLLSLKLPVEVQQKVSKKNFYKINKVDKLVRLFKFI